jgi:AraC-like DNA-binding protein
LSKPHKRLRETRFANERLDSVGVELLTISELRARASAQVLSETERVAFFLVLVATAGRGEHLVDFERLALRPGDVAFVRPGQVQQWQLQRSQLQQPQSPEGFEADVLLIDPAVIQPAVTVSGNAATALLRLGDWPARFRMGTQALGAWKSLAAMLRRELEQPRLDELAAAMARELLLCMMLHMCRSATRRAAAPTPQAELIRRLRNELEARMGTRPSIALLARSLRVSTSTLTRACKDMLGCSTKEALDRRVALEAQRLLVHSTATSVVIGEQLGFSEPTNFVKFFRRRVGMRPEAFRQAHRLRRG